MRSFLSAAFLFLICSSKLNAQVNHWETIVSQGDLFHYQIPVSEPAAAWRLSGFNDASWQSGKCGIGYGDGDDSTIVPDGTPAVYMRRQFSVADTSKIQEAIFDMDYDDAFVAYLNGVEIARANVGTAGTPPVYTDLSYADHEAQLYAGGLPDAFFINHAALSNILVNGVNTLSIQVYNISASSSDLTAIPFFSVGIKDASFTYGPTPAWFVPPVTLSTKLPIIIINTAGQTIPYGTKINANMKVIDHPGGAENVETDAPDNYDGKIGIEVRGASSSGFPQQPYGIETRDVNDDNDTDVAFLGMPEESDWNLISNYNDKAFLRNLLSYKIAAEMGYYAPRYRLCEVIINGQYRGIYLATEKIKRGHDRVDIAKLGSDDNAGDSVTGGYIFKVDYWDPGNSWLSSYHPFDHPSYDVNYVYYYPKVADITDPQKAYIHGYIDSLEGALYSAGFADTNQGYRRYLDINSFVDYLVVNEISRNNDGFKKSCYFNKDKASKGGKLHAGPVWDFDWAWKDINQCFYGVTDGSSWSYQINDCSPDVNSNGWVVRMMQDTNFVNLFHCRYATLRSSVLDTNTLFSFIDSMAVVLDSAQLRHYQVYNTWGQDPGAPETEAPSNNYAEEIARLKHFISVRFGWLDANIPGHCPQPQPTSVAAGNVLMGPAVYPNPAGRELQVRGDARFSSISIRDVTGRELVAAALKSGNTTIPLQALPAGVYSYQIRDSNGAVLERGKFMVAQ